MQTFPYENESFDTLLTVSEVAHLLRVHPSTIRRWEQEGQLKSYRLGRKSSIRFKKADISSFVNSASKKTLSGGG